MVRPTTICLSLLLASAIIGCDDEGTTTSCDEMPLLSAEPSQAEQEAFERWYDEAVREGCATPAGDPEDFDTEPPGAAGAGN